MNLISCPLKTSSATTLENNMNRLDDYIKAYEEAEKVAEMYDADIQEKTLINIGYEPVKIKASDVKVLQNRLYKIIYGA